MRVNKMYKKKSPKGFIEQIWNNYRGTTHNSRRGGYAAQYGSKDEHRSKNLILIKR